MPLPKEVYESPEKYIDFITLNDDSDFEGQHFDRKELCRNEKGYISNTDLRRLKNDQITECISAFANENKQGGLLVLGVSTSGVAVGLNHLNETQINGISSFDYISNHNCQFKLFEFDVNGKTAQIGLIYVPYADRNICGTARKPFRAWRRSGLQNIELNDEDLQRIRRDKRIVDYERTHCSRYSEDDLDKAVYKEFKTAYLDNSSYEWDEEKLLTHIGAVDDSGEKWFTNAGKLFFSTNPGRDIPQAFVRLLRFDVNYDEREKRSIATYDKKFTGPISKQIRDFRSFIKDSAFFDVYQRRREGGGFIEEPEYPEIAIDEALVNAIVHRDYAISTPILCEKYIDAFVVTNPGPIIQNKYIPHHFSLENTSLQSYTRNPQLMGWLQEIKDANGRTFVQALQEGTRRMYDEAEKLNLPAPEYFIGDSDTRLILKNDHIVRKSIGSDLDQDDVPEFSNMYPLRGFSGGEGKDKQKEKRKELLQALKNKLVANGWYIDSYRFGKLVAHVRQNNFHTPENVSKVVRLYPSFTFQVREYYGKQYLLIDYVLTVQSVLNLNQCLSYLDSKDLLGMRCVAKYNEWSEGKIAEVDAANSKVSLFEYEVQEYIPNSKIIPKLTRTHIDIVLKKSAIQIDLSKLIKQHSLSIDKNASRIRADRTQNVVFQLIDSIFPLSLPGTEIMLSGKSLTLSERGNGASQLQVKSISEPKVEFSHQHLAADVRQGITEFGAYETSPRNIEIVPICEHGLRSNMESLILRLKDGKYKYKGSEKTFGTRLTFNSVIDTPYKEAEAHVVRLLDQHPEWKGNSLLDRIFLVHCPESEFALDDEHSPYYKIKRILFEAGIPCQMIDTPTLLNADWKDLNLALNIVAKCGRTPWVLPESIPDCDFFIGLSYTQNRKSSNSKLMAFANVFNQFGRWEFYSGGADTFSFDDRVFHYESLVVETMSKLSLSEEPSICFQYTAKFSKEDKHAILKAARRVRPKGKYTFVWINTHHSIRFYDKRTETDGSMSRGRYVLGGRNQVYLSTSGNNPYRRAMGTPIPLEINVSVERYGREENPDLKVTASQVLSLTKLNWASTDSLCAEPITTKYASDIAYLTAAFLRQKDSFTLHPVLEKTPWFI